MRCRAICEPLEPVAPDTSDTQHLLEPAPRITRELPDDLRRELRGDSRTS